ncbi:MAG: hypothetical protein J6L76_06280 [Clostridia bacterium]|nr:hypothetical protein [Clostridia bacterium]
MKRSRILIGFIALMLTLVTLVGCGGGTEADPSATTDATMEATGEPGTTAGATSKPTSSATQKPGGTTLKELRAKTQVGAWYSLWYDGTGADSFWETVTNDYGQRIPILYKPLLPDGTFGRYDSSDGDVMQFHLQEIAKAGIDFLIFDQTNDIDAQNAKGVKWINLNSIKMAKAITEWNKVKGNRQIRYCSAVGTFASVDKATGQAYASGKKKLNVIEEEAEKLYARYIKREWGSEKNHVYVDGKPLLVVFTVTQAEWEAYAKSHDTPYADKFTLRFAVGHAYDPGLWGWVIPKAQVTEDVVTINPGWFKDPHPLEKVYRKRGETYKTQWETILSSNITPNFIVINSINEYAEQTAIWPADTSDFPANHPIERWLNKDGQEDPYLYWNMTKTYIQKYRNGDKK